MEKKESLLLSVMTNLDSLSSRNAMDWESQTAAVVSGIQ